MLAVACAACLTAALVLEAVFPAEVTAGRWCDAAVLVFLVLAVVFPSGLRRPPPGQRPDQQEHEDPPE